MHGGSLSLGLVIIAQKMQRAVDGVQGQLSVERMAALGGLAPGGVDGDDDLALHLRRLRGVAKIEGQHIRGPLVLEVPFVELSHTGIIDDGYVDFGAGRAMLGQRGFDGAAQQGDAVFGIVAGGVILAVLTLGGRLFGKRGSAS